ncbi:MAG: beta-lactamase family protein [Dinghuibacter sp.]|nr:beta-lactamase family protein [Dinghuibacter sp.]
MKKQLLLNCLFLFLFYSENIAQNAKIDSFLAIYAEKNNFNGTVLIGERGRVTTWAAFGMANRSFPAKVSRLTRFRIASITKTFTATLILQLMEEGKIDLSHTISHYLPEYTGEVAKKATIHHLLTYSSGMENKDQNNEEMYALQLHPDTIVTRYCSGKMVYEPGTRMDYKNAEYILLGKIIEKITQKSFKTVLLERILKPLNMQRSGYLQNKDVIFSLASSYLADSSGHFFNDDPFWIENFQASGAMYSTAEDLYRFDQALFGARLLRPETVRLMTTPYPELWGVAYSFWVNKKDFGKKTDWVVDRRGSISGNNAAWYHFINSNITIIILSNTTATDLVDFREKIAEIVVK